MEKPRISILMPVFNGERFIAETLDSITSQTSKEWEIILMDGASKDRTVEIARSYAEKHPNIRIFSAPDEGPYDAFHKALPHVRGDFVIMVCASDGLLNKRWLELCIDAFDKDPEISVVWGVPFDAAGDGSIIGPHFAFAHFLKEGRSRMPLLREIFARMRSPRMFFNSLRKLRRAHFRAISGVVALENPPQKQEWLPYWLETGTVFPDGNMCIAKNVFKECLAPYKAGTRETGDWMSFYFDINAKGYLAWCIPVPANFGRRSHGPQQITVKVQGYNDDRRARYLERIAAFRKELKEGRRSVVFRDRDGNPLKK